jgi:hypothetical protein
MGSPPTAKISYVSLTMAPMRRFHLIDLAIFIVAGALNARLTTALIAARWDTHLSADGVPEQRYCGRCYAW